MSRRPQIPSLQLDLYFSWAFPIPIEIPTGSPSAHLTAQPELAYTTFIMHCDYGAQGGRIDARGIFTPCAPGEHIGIHILGSAYRNMVPSVSKVKCKRLGNRIHIRTHIILYGDIAWTLSQLPRDSPPLISSRQLQNLACAVNRLVLWKTSGPTIG